MAYAQGRRYCDADSHIMELPDFLRAHADPDMRERMPRVSVSAGGRLSAGIEEFARACESMITRGQQTLVLEKLDLA